MQKADDEVRRIAANSRGRFIVHRGHQPPPIEDYPKGFSPYKGGWGYAEISETVVDPKHKGAPKYEQRDYHVARITKIIAPQKAN